VNIIVRLFYFFIHGYKFFIHSTHTFILSILLDKEHEGKLQYKSTNYGKDSKQNHTSRNIPGIFQSFLFTYYSIKDPFKFRNFFIISNSGVAFLTVSYKAGYICGLFQYLFVKSVSSNFISLRMKHSHSVMQKSKRVIRLIVFIRLDKLYKLIHYKIYPYNSQKLSFIVIHSSGHRNYILLIIYILIGICHYSYPRITDSLFIP